MPSAPPPFRRAIARDETHRSLNCTSFWQGQFEDRWASGASSPASRPDLRPSLPAAVASSSGDVAAYHDQPLGFPPMYYECHYGTVSIATPRPLHWLGCSEFCLSAMRNGNITSGIQPRLFSLNVNQSLACYFSVLPHRKTQIRTSSQERNPVIPVLRV